MDSTTKSTSQYGVSEKGIAVLHSLTTNKSLIYVMICVQVDLLMNKDQQRSIVLRVTSISKGVRFVMKMEAFAQNAGDIMNLMKWLIHATVQMDIIFLIFIGSMLTSVDLVINSVKLVMDLILMTAFLVEDLGQ